MANTRPPPSSRLTGWMWIGLGLLVWPASAPAQPAVPRDVTAAGGGAAAAGPYALIDTAGQPATGSASSAAYTVNAGFWGTFGSPPLPYALVLTTLSNQPVQFPVATLLAGSDADGDAVSLVSIASSSTQGGIVTLSSGLVTYTPPKGFLGTDSFSYTIKDTGGDTAAGAVSINNLPPFLTVTTAADSGPGSLRQFLTEINAAGTNNTWYVDFAPGLAGQTISLSNSATGNFGPSALLVSNVVIINGADTPGVSLRLDPSSTPMRLFFVAKGAQLTLENITLQNGVAQGGAGSSGSGGGGGGAGLGGAIYNQGTVALFNVLLSSNQAVGGVGGSWASGAPGAGGSPNGGGGGSSGAGYGGGAGGGVACGGDGGTGAGGAIFNDGGTLSMNSCVLLNNLARGGAGGAGASGCNGANESGLGAGLFNHNGMAHVTTCLFTNNNADVGNGIANLGDGMASWVYLTQDTLTNAGSTNDFLSLNTNGGDAQTVEIAGAFDSQYSLWISPVADIGTIQTNHPLSVPVVLHPPAGLGNAFPLQAVSANLRVVPAAGLAFSGSGTNFTLTLTPGVNQTGSSLITVSSDAAGFSAAATFTATFGLFGNIFLSAPNRLLTVTADPGLRCFVQYTTNLFNPNWTALGQATETSSGFYQLIDTAPRDPVRYYRILVQ